MKFGNIFSTIIWSELNLEPLLSWFKCSKQHKSDYKLDRLCNDLNGQTNAQINCISTNTIYISIFRRKFEKKYPKFWSNFGITVESSKIDVTSWYQYWWRKYSRFQKRSTTWESLIRFFQHWILICRFRYKSELRLKSFIFFIISTFLFDRWIVSTYYGMNSFLIVTWMCVIEHLRQFSNIRTF